MSRVGKLTELAGAALWDLGLDLLGLYESLDSLSSALMALALLACIFFWPFLLYFLAKCVFLRNLGSTPLRDSYRCDRGLLMPFLWHFRDWLCVVWFSGLAMFALGPADPEAPGARRDQGGLFIDQWTYQGMANPEEFRAASRGVLSAPHPRDKERDR